MNKLIIPLVEHAICDEGEKCITVSEEENVSQYSVEMTLY
jgi:hypothetical protein